MYFDCITHKYVNIYISIDMYVGKKPIKFTFKRHLK